MSKIGTDTITQIGIIVKDIEKTAASWSEFLGVKNPGWNWTGTLDEAETEYRGKQTEGRAKLAFFSMDNIQIELIEPDTHPSTWREYLDSHGEGVHHIAFVINGMKHAINILSGSGINLVQKGEYTGGRYAYMDAESSLKVILELLEND